MKIELNKQTTTKKTILGKNPLNCQRTFDSLILPFNFLIQKCMYHPSNKVTGCLSVPNDLANRSTVMMPLHRVPSHRSSKGHNFLGGGYHLPPSKSFHFYF